MTAQEIGQQIDETLAKLKRERDELRVQVNLAKLEVRDDWKAAEAKLGQLEAKANEVGSATADSAKAIGEAAKKLAGEVRDAFKNIARSL